MRTDGDASSSAMNDTAITTPTPAAVVDEYLRLLMIPDPDSARRFVAPDLRIRFTGGRAMRDPAECTAFNAGALPLGEEAHRAHRDGGRRQPMPKTVVYSIGTLYGEWPDGTPFEGNRYVDRYVVQRRPHRADGRVERQRRVAAGARRPGHAREAAMRRTDRGPLPDHGRFDYRPITRRAALPLARRRRAGGVHRLQPRALRFRRGPGRGDRPAVAAARRAELQLARVRQPRRRLALPRAVRRARPAGRRR